MSSTPIRSGAAATAATTAQRESARSDKRKEARAAEAETSARASNDKKLSARRSRQEELEESEDSPVGKEALFNLFGQIRWPDLKDTSEKSGGPSAATTACGPMRAEEETSDDDHPGQAVAAPLSPVSMRGNMDVVDAQAAPPQDEAKLQELQMLMQKLAARISTTGDGPGFVIALSQPLFAGTSLGVRMQGGQYEVDYQSTEAAEEEWFDGHAGVLAQRIESALKRPVRFRRKQGEAEP